MHQPQVCRGGVLHSARDGRIRDSKNASAASLLWRGRWPPWQVPEKPLPVYV